MPDCEFSAASPATTSSPQLRRVADSGRATREHALPTQNSSLPLTPASHHPVVTALLRELQNPPASPWPWAAAERQGGTWRPTSPARARGANGQRAMHTGGGVAGAAQILLDELVGDAVRELPRAWRGAAVGGLKQRPAAAASHRGRAAVDPGLWSGRVI